MNHVTTIFKKELRSYFSSPIGFVFIIFYLLVSNAFFFFVQDFFRQGQVTMRGYFAAMPWVFLFFVPAITMRLWAEEKKMGTVELLLTMPMKEWEVVLGKFLAAFGFLAITLAFSFTIPATLMYLGKPDLGVIVGSYVGALFLGSAYLAIGLYISSLTENQVVAFIISLAVIFVLLLIGIAPVWLNALGTIVSVCEYVSLLSHFNNVTRGVIDSRDVIYYASVIALFLYLNVKNIEARKWR
ncbi:MAG: putative transporter, permease protein [Fibrobacteres bacterium]|nr:putative transporter, permease protein [Fibrobacterota bacterium]